MMNKLPLVLTVSLCCLLPGCASQGTGRAPGGNAAASSSPYPDAPAGMYVGSGYTSALNEQCYELLPSGGPGQSAQAICLRGETWTVLSPIFASLPDNPSVAR